MKLKLICLGSVALLAGCVPDYRVPTENFATVEFSSLGSPIFAMYSKGGNCSGMTRIPQENAPGNPNATPLRVSSGIEIAFGATGVNGNPPAWCNAMTSFVPAAGAHYTVTLAEAYPQGCGVRIQRVEAGRAVDEPSSRSKRVRNVFPMYPTGSYCHAD